MCVGNSADVKCDSMKILKIVNYNDILEIQYHEQEGIEGCSPHMAEAQLFVKGHRYNGGVGFDLDELEDIDAVISTLTEIREKMLLHLSKKKPLS